MHFTAIDSVVVKTQTLLSSNGGFLTIAMYHHITEKQYNQIYYLLGHKHARMLSCQKKVYCKKHTMMKHRKWLKTHRYSELKLSHGNDKHQAPTD